MRTPALAPALVASAALLLSPSPRAADFTTGDLFLYSPAVTGSSSVDGAILRIDPLSGATSVFVDTWATQSNGGSMAWDPYREGLLFCAGLDDVSQPKHLWLLDGAAARLDLGFVGETLHALAPTPFGHVYLRQGAPADQIRYLDPFNQLHTLLDETGSAPFDLVPGSNGSLGALIYHAGTHSLVAACGPNLAPACAGGVSSKVTLWRVPLSLDGTRVAGPVDCAEFEVSTSGETPVQFSAAPGDTLLLIVDTNSNSAEPRMVQLDPLTMAVAAYASNGSYVGAAATNAGCTSGLLGKAVILDTFADSLRAFGFGESGAGTILPTTMPVSAAGSSGEVATLIEVPGGGCDGQYTLYGSGLAGTGGRLPTLRGTNCPEIGKALTIEIDDVRGAAPGVLWVGTGQSSVPFKGGQFLVLPLALTLDLVVDGVPGAAGDGAATVPVLLPNDPSWIGLTITLQAGFADAAAVLGASLSNGLRLDVG